MRNGMVVDNPIGLKEDNITEHRIVALADVYDA